MEFKNYYEILGVEQGASADDIKRAYRRLARKYHPDVSTEPEAEARFKEMKEAYEVLKDPEKRAAYDRFGKDWKAGQDFRPPPDWEREFSFSESEGPRAEHFSDFFETLFGGGRGFERRGGRMRMDGEDINARIAISLEDAFKGGTRQIQLDMPEVDAGGRVRNRRKKLNVRIPKGVTAGQRIRLEDQGGAGLGADSRAGDLYLEVEFEPHPVFSAKGRDIHLVLPVSVPEAALGRTVKAPTLGGPVDLKIPAGASSGQRLRLRGRGLPGKPPGDQFVELRVVLPESLSDASRELYERLEQEQPFNPRADLGI